MNREYGYGFGDLRGDYFRSIVGILLTAIPFVFVRPVTFVAVIIIVIGATFAIPAANSGQTYIQDRCRWRRDQPGDGV